MVDQTQQPRSDQLTIANDQLIYNVYLLNVKITLKIIAFFVGYSVPAADVEPQTILRLLPFNTTAVNVVMRPKRL